MQLCEKYRPKTFDTFLGNDKAVARVQRIISRPAFGDGAGEALWISGKSGIGKTTLAQIISRTLGVQPGPAWNYVELDGDKASVDMIRRLDHRTQAAGLFADQWQVFIVNESHAMKGQAVNAWLTLLERLPAKWLVIFTTTEAPDSDLFGNFTEPLLGRCKVFELTNQGLADAFASRALEIARVEDLDGKPLAQYKRLASRCHNSMRAMLQAIDAGEMLD